MTLLLVGSNHHTAPVELRERLYLESDTLQNVMQQLYRYSDSIKELAIISTCNRFEVYATVDEMLSAQENIINFMGEFFAIATSELLPALYIHEDELAIKHLMSVSAGLNSMILGEAQILGQVSKALEHATSASTTGAYIHRLFETAIHAGKRARSETKISQHTTSISHAAALLMRQNMTKPDPGVLILGAGEMAELAVFAVHKFGLSHVGVVNRTFENAQALATKFGAKAHPWSELDACLLDADVLITATGASHFLLDADYLKLMMQKRKGKEFVIVDIAVPRDIDPGATEITGIHYFDIDSLQHIVDDSLSAREACIPQVKAIIEEEASRYLQWLRERVLVPVIKDLRQEVASVVEDELKEAIQKMPELSDAELVVVKRMAHRITNKVLYAPTKTLRSRADDANVEIYAGIVRDLFALDTQSSDSP